MKMYHIICGAALASAALIANLPAAAQPKVAALGTWTDEDGKSNIEIAPCGNFLCGRVVWLREPNDETGNPKTDINNPDAAQRTRPIIGMTIIKNLAPSEDEGQLKGLVYNAEDGKVYDLYLTPRQATMEVEGCFALFLCGSQTWTRVR